MKRSQQVILVLSGALTAAPLSCSRSPDQVELSSNSSYTNNHYVHGVGYYHAPYHAWFPFPYNSYAPGRGYYHGGTWSTEPHQSSVRVSQPAPSVVHTAQASHNNAVRRSGFGSSSRSGIS